MATVIDITGKLRREKKYIRIGETDYPVDDSKNTVTEVMALLEDKETTETEKMDIAMAHILGEEACGEVAAMNLNLTDYQAVFIGTMAAVTGKTYEETEQSFRRTAN